jgi:hypothetical protein
VTRHLAPRRHAPASSDAAPADPAPASAGAIVDGAVVAAIAAALALESATPLPVGPPAPSGWRTAARLEGIQRLA